MTRLTLHAIRIVALMLGATVALGLLFRGAVAVGRMLP
jgi:hypothetical protein